MNEIQQFGLENVRIIVAPKGVRPGRIMALLVRQAVDLRAELSRKTSIMLAVGRQQRPFFRKILQMHGQGWSTIADQDYFTQDDWVIDPSHPNSLQATAKKRLLNPLGVKPEQCIFPSPENIDRYPELLGERGGVNIAVFGIGAKGHFAFARAGAQYCLGRPVRMEADLESRVSNQPLFGGVLERVPTEVVSIRFGTVQEAGQVFLIMESKEYWEAADKALFGPVTVDCPCSLFRTLKHWQATILIGAGLAAHLRDKGRKLEDQSDPGLRKLLKYGR